MGFRDRLSLRSIKRPRLEEPGTSSLNSRSETVGSDKTLVNPSSFDRLKQAVSSPPASPSPAPIFPDGVEVLHDCPDANVDICFVHGLTGDRRNTWTARGEVAPWPETLLPPRLPQARILTYGYDAYVVRKQVSSTTGLVDHATNLLADLTRDRASCNAASRPIIFVAHSLGGLVCKQAILLSRNNPDDHLRSIFDCVSAIAFMGTPHTGSDLAQWARMPVSALGLVSSVNKSLLQVLKTDDQLLSLLQNQFSSMLRELRESGRKLQVTCFYEELPLRLVGLVVPKASATLTSYSAIGIHANHRDMARFTSADETGFKRLHGELSRWKADLKCFPPLQKQKKSGSGEDESPAVDQNVLQGCLSSLAFPEMETRLLDVEDAARGTCQWVFEEPEYKNWETSARSLLWIKGKPGSGKSILMRHLFSSLSQGSRALPGAVVLSFFFHGRGTQLQRGSFGLYRALLHQLLSRFPAVSPEILAKFRKKTNELGKYGTLWSWHPREVQEDFKKLLFKVLYQHPVFLLIDALDECGEDNAVSILDELKDLLGGLPQGALPFRICLACRHYPNLGWEEHKICTEDKNAEDITSFVQSRLHGYPAAIPEMISGQASGVFLWARLIVEGTRKLERRGESWKKIERELTNAPKELRTLYSDLVNQLPEPSASLKLLRWLCFSYRPLAVAEIREALLIDPKCAFKTASECRESDEYIEEEARLQRKIEALTCGLAGITQYSGAKDKVELIHQSVKDFFVNEGICMLEGRVDGTQATLSETEAAAKSHYELSRSCLRYTLMEDIVAGWKIPGPKLVRLFPLVEYASSEWASHARSSQQFGQSQEDLLDFLGWPSDSFLTAAFCIEKRVDEDARRSSSVETTYTFAHLFCLYRLVDPLRAVLTSKPELASIPDRNGFTPISLAVMAGNMEIINLLMETGTVDLMATSNTGVSPLLHAVWGGEGNSVRWLLDSGKVDVNAATTSRQTPLLLAAESAGGDDILEMLLAHPDIKAAARNLDGRTALVLAASKGFEKKVQLLLDHGGVDVNIEDADGLNAYEWACRLEQDKTAQILKDSGKLISLRVNHDPEITWKRTDLVTRITMRRWYSGAYTGDDDEYGCCGYKMRNKLGAKFQEQVNAYRTAWIDNGPLKDGKLVHY